MQTGSEKSKQSFIIKNSPQPNDSTELVVERVYAVFRVHLYNYGFTSPTRAHVSYLY